MLKDGQTDKKYAEHKDGDRSSQQALLSDKGIYIYIYIYSNHQCEHKIK